MFEMSDYNFAMYFWSTVAAASVALPVAVALVREIAKCGRADLPRTSR